MFFRLLFDFPEGGKNSKVEKQVYEIAKVVRVDKIQNVEISTLLESISVICKIVIYIVIEMSTYLRWCRPASVVSVGVGDNSKLVPNKADLPVGNWVFNIRVRYKKVGKK
jgi:hypothetical protein